MNLSPTTRRGFLQSTAGIGAAALAACNRAGPPASAPPGSSPAGPADITLRIGPVLADIAKDHTISTIGYNGQTPGPLIRMREGVPVTVDLFNDTDAAEFVHWHGLIIPADVDGAAEEKSLAVPARGHIRYSLTPRPSGVRFVHSHVMPMSDLNRGTYTGQFAIVHVEPKDNPGQYDQEIFLITHEWEPFYTGEEEMEDEDITPAEKARKEQEDKKSKPNGWEIGYQRFTINGKALGYGDPVRVRQGQRVLFHIVNGSATENIQLALAGHRFRVVALDGNAVPTPQLVDVLDLGTAERISAVVEMNNPGIWVLGTPHDDDRKNGMGLVVEYADKTGAPRWIKPVHKPWDYTMFGETRTAPEPVESIPLSFGKINGGTGAFNHWTVNGKMFDENAPPRQLKKGSRYRLIFDNQTDDPHPVHLHRNTFELTNVYGKATAGVMKDVVLVKGYRKIAVDFTPPMEGLTLFHCHQQLHMDYGFKTLFNVT
ncbi:MAG TPA: multicopper oxidase domain-containing protein [Bryobacteraceae bacterium]|jgi:FtsP/CotA-like multicopper oxidase with cupredoxin domain|nr:multicopper oxidase domain-containing protein [Bryobacteraceae bacterium]